MRAAQAFISRLAEGFADVAAAGADLLLLSTTTAPLGWHVAEATGIPSLNVYLQPTAPTGDFPPTVMGTRSLGRAGNRAVGRLALRMVDRVYAPAVAGLRAGLGLPAMTTAQMRRYHDEASPTVLHGLSTALLPRPCDWRTGLKVTGAWHPYVDPSEELPAKLVDFLDSGPPPVFIGFGSMAAGEGERLGQIVAAALRRAGLRGVLQAGSAGLAADGDDLLSISAVPHALLFPRLAAVVHHAGAGTSAAALSAGLPSVTVPFTADQPFWAARLAAIGAAATPIPFRSLNTKRLTDALTDVMQEPSYSAAAAAAAAHMAAEEGVDAVVRGVRRLGGRRDGTWKASPGADSFK